MFFLSSAGGGGADFDVYHPYSFITLINYLLAKEVGYVGLGDYLS